MRARLQVTAWVRRLVVLNAGLAFMGLGTSAMLAAGMGVAPWAVFHEGVALSVGVSHGTVSQLVGLALLVVAWTWLGQRPGIGTALNMVMLGLWIDVFRAQPWLPSPDTVAFGALQHLAATGLYAFASALYMVADIGAGPRDSVMLGAAARFQTPVRTIRTWIEVLVLGAGWALGGPVGVGTLIYALVVGPLVQACLRWLRAFVRRYPALLGPTPGGSAPPATGRPPTQPGRRGPRTRASPQL
jgi:uncharacterized membrane protein YczE